jgi:hypothetical protein
MSVLSGMDMGSSLPMFPTSQGCRCLKTSTEIVSFMYSLVPSTLIKLFEYGIASNVS